MSLNKVMLIGNLGQDPLVKYLDNNRVAAHFSMATHEQFTDRNGERKVETEWHQVEAWDQLAKSIDQLKIKGILRKGTQVFVEGKIRTEKFIDKNGVEQTRKKIKANQVQLLGSPKSPEERPSNPEPESENQPLA